MQRVPAPIRAALGAHARPAARPEGAAAGAAGCAHRGRCGGPGAAMTNFKLMQGCHELC